MISLQKSNKSFKDECAVNQLSLAVSGSEIYGLFGSNGAGRSLKPLIIDLK